MQNQFNSKIWFDSYQKYKENSFTSRRFKHSEILTLINKLKNNSAFTLGKIGSSVEGRDIFSVKIGEGKIKLLLWSQMHGDEPTATMSFFDIFNFFSVRDENLSFKNEILNKLTIYFIPMLNPDGAEIVKRRNALNIDLNRDALALTSPEAKVLKNIAENIKPDFGFNMHDQDIRWTVGGSEHPATIALLAPPYNHNNSFNEVRTNAAKLIVDIYKELKKYIPGNIAKYKDEHEPRSFGDKMTEWGISTILIESGRRKNDAEKDYIRKLNFISLLTAFRSIAINNYQNNDIETYNNIPRNSGLLFDRIFRNLSFNRSGENYKIDVAVNIEEYCTDTGETYFKGTIQDAGDLSGQHAYSEINCENMEIFPGKIYTDNLLGNENVERNLALELLKEGYTYIKTDLAIDRQFSKLPINILAAYKKYSNRIQFEKEANFYIQNKGRIKYTVINGFVYDCEDQIDYIKNALVFK